MKNLKRIEIIPLYLLLADITIYQDKKSKDFKYYLNVSEGDRNEILKPQFVSDKVAIGILICFCIPDDFKLNELDNIKNLLSNHFGIEMQYYGGEGFHSISGNGKFRLKFGYSSGDRIWDKHFSKTMNFTSKLDLIKYYDKLKGHCQEVAAWNDTGLPELISCHCYGEIPY